MNSNHVTVNYSWTAHPGKLDELTAIYAEVTAQMEANEPGAEEVQVHVSKAEGRIYVRDEFVDAEAVGFHLGTTAASHFESLLAVATPGTFYFLGEIPEEMKAATAQMGLPAEYGSRMAGFAR
ncbi:MAG: antibiotic biosynthesis monooxygenase [Actinomycetota bacterium]